MFSFKDVTVAALITTTKKMETAYVSKTEGFHYPYRGMLSNSIKSQHGQKSTYMRQIH